MHLYLSYNSNFITICKLENKLIYKTFFNQIIKPPSALYIWANTYPFLDKFEWGPVFNLTYLITQEPYVRSFQYKITNRILNCRNNLFKWKIVDNNKCSLCSQTDTIEHHLFECKHSTEMQLNLEQWLKLTFDINISFTVCEVLFGIVRNIFNNETEHKIVNFLI